MTEGQEAHLARIKDVFEFLVDSKYRRGAKEHKGRLYECNSDDLLWESIMEAIDLFTYLITEWDRRHADVVETSPVGNVHPRLDKRNVRYSADNEPTHGHRSNKSGVRVKD